MSRLHICLRKTRGGPHKFSTAGKTHKRLKLYHTTFPPVGTSLSFKIPLHLCSASVIYLLLSPFLYLHVDSIFFMHWDFVGYFTVNCGRGTNGEREIAESMLAGSVQIQSPSKVAPHMKECKGSEPIQIAQKMTAIKTPLSSTQPIDCC